MEIGCFFGIIQNENVIVVFEGWMIVKRSGCKLNRTAVQLFDLNQLFFGKREPVRNGKHAGRLLVLIQQHIQIHRAKLQIVFV